MANRIPAARLIHGRWVRRDATDKSEPVVASRQIVCRRARGKTSHYIRSDLNTLFNGFPFRPAMPVPQRLQIRVGVRGLSDGCLVDGHRLVEP